MLQLLCPSELTHVAVMQQNQRCIYGIALSSLEIAPPSRVCQCSCCVMEEGLKIDSGTQILLLFCHAHVPTGWFGCVALAFSTLILIHKSSPGTFGGCSPNLTVCLFEKKKVNSETISVLLVEDDMAVFTLTAFQSYTRVHCRTWSQ